MLAIKQNADIGSYGTLLAGHTVRRLKTGDSRGDEFAS
jgi:hypothetical protein